LQVIKNRQFVTDGWQLLAADADLPPGGDVIVGLERWNAEQDSLSSRDGLVGVLLRGEDAPERIAALERVPLVAIEFPKFADGRGFSHARLLRERLGFRGEIRAVGDVLRDQLFYMARCGIDSFALKPGKDIVGALSAFDDFSVTYQAGADDRRPLFRRVQR
jgi:uncharacterized protein (DUF934 family)